jgi:hypothetical protein
VFNVRHRVQCEAPCSMSGKANHVGVTNMDEFDSSSLHPLKKHLEPDMFPAGIEPRPHASQAALY